jgi:mRNA-degrading endonuclease RelE of RelBE toxin-antitoxin system
MPTFNIEYTAEFKRNLRQLAKKYRRIKTDLQELLDQLAKGNKLGDQIRGVVYEVFKARVKNSDSARGKSGGYRVIYQCKDEQIILITIYSKSEQQDIEPSEIQQIISDYDTQILSNSENTVQEPSSEIVNNPEDTLIEPDDKV